MTGGPIDRISTHVVDTSVGRPAAGIEVTLFFLDAADVGGTAGERVGSGRTDADGRVPALAAGPLPTGNYRLVFDTAAYFTSVHGHLFYPRIVVEFFLDGARPHYHIPVLASTFSYSTYLGS